jgi:F-box-like
MAPSRILSSGYSEESGPPSKRLRRESDAGYARDNDCDILPSHPLNVRPEGNTYTEESKQNIRQNSGLFAHLPDELLMHFLDYLNAHQLLALGSTCKALYAFAYFDDLWRSLFVL